MIRSQTDIAQAHEAGNDVDALAASRPYRSWWGYRDTNIMLVS
jgi:hypothetical protein